MQSLGDLRFTDKDTAARNCRINAIISRIGMILGIHITAEKRVELERMIGDGINPLIENPIYK